LGLPLGLVAILLAGILSENSIQALLRFSRPCNATSYGALMANAFGEAGRIVLQLCIIINNFGSLIVYIIIIGLQIFFLMVFLSSSIQVSLFVFCNLIFCITLRYLIFDGFLIPQYLCTPLFFFSCFGFVLKDSLELWAFSDPFGWFPPPPL
jgi:amino acid permease